MRLALRKIGALKRRRRRWGTWGYAIDYDKEIAIDAAEVARLESPVQRAVSAMTTGETKYIHDDVPQWLLFDGSALSAEQVRSRATVLGMSDQDIRDLAAFCEFEDCLPAALAGDASPNWYTRGKAICDQLETHQLRLVPEQARKTALRHAKSNLARHRRNKSKYGSNNA